LTSIASRETEIRGGERPVGIVETSKVADNVGVISNVAARSAKQVRRELTAGRKELLEDNGLSLDLADLFCYDLSGHFLQHEESLLDNLDADGLANNLFLLLDHDLAADYAREVILAVKVVETVETGDTTPVIERSVATSQALGPGVERCSEDIAGQSRNGKQGKSKFGEHDDSEGVTADVSECKDCEGTKNSRKGARKATGPKENKRLKE